MKDHRHRLQLGRVGPFGRPRRYLLLPDVLAAGLLFLLACRGCGPSIQELRDAALRAALVAHQAQDAARQAADRSAVASAVERARHSIWHTLDRFDPASEAVFTASCGAWLEAGDIPHTLQCLQQAGEHGYQGAQLRLIEARVLMAESRYDQARQLLFALRDEVPHDEQVRSLLMDAFVQDPLFFRPVETLQPGVDIDQIRALGGGSTLTMRLKRDGETIAAFKPNQTRRQSNYRAEVAAYRLCPMIHCGFEVPYSFEVRIERRDFMRLYGIRSLEEGTGYASGFSDLVWTTDQGQDYLYGVWKDWVPHFTKFPIEYDEVWSSWVSTDGDPAELDRPLSETLAPLRGREEGNYDEILTEAGNATTRELARQISNMLVFDFLINNWDRFSGAYYGVNCQWAEGRFVSIDNGAGFMTRDPHRPRTHLYRVTRFSESLVREVRQLDRTALLAILFPDPSSDEQERYEAFLERVDEFLEYIDRLVEERGEDAVLFFP